MKPNALLVALMTAAAAFPGSTRAADDVCSRMFLYAINQICQLLPNGQSLCQPIGLAGPDPSCKTPSTSTLVQVPLGPPVVQPPQRMTPLSPFAGLANPFATYPPVIPMPPVAASLPPSPPLTAQSALPPIVAATVKPVATTTTTPLSAAPIAAAPIPTVEQTLTKLMPDSAKGEKSAVADKAPVAAAPLAVPKIPESPAAPVARPAPLPGSNLAIQTPAVPAVAEASKSKTEAAKPEVAADVVATPLPPVMAATATKPATPVNSVGTASPPDATSDAAAIGPVAAPVNMAPTPATPVHVQPAHAAPVLAGLPPVTTIAKDADSPAQAETARIAAEKALADALAHFEFDSAELTPRGRAMLDDWLKQAAANKPILVTGHADRLGPEPYNEKLSLLRAEAVKKYLTEKGQSAKRIEILAKGEHDPLINCAGNATPETKACLAPNRRAEITFKPSSKPAARKAVQKKSRPVAKPAKSTH